VDTDFFVGNAAFISAILIFCGSVWLLLAVLMGAKLAYLVSASVTLSFVLIMSLVWSYGDPLGPVGELPKWDPVDIQTDASDLSFGPAAQYPNDPWHEADAEDDEQRTQVSELESAATDYLEDAINEGTVDAYSTTSDVSVTADSARLTEQGGDTFGLIQLEPALTDEGDPGEGPELFVVMEWDPGNPSRPARQLALGVLIVFAGHVFLLSRAEKRSKRNRDNANDTAAA
jgi:hypothetical protein